MDEMEKIEFKDLPSEETPINAKNLNLLQDNVSNKILDVENKILDYEIVEEWED